ncbi:DUF547 domain-containing protein [Kordia zhangzhouensis]|uniref:DUF547 domain-containing protein n=1 Tax=Kordia zhangzhouensis TaxID=1620405 RepID=UPI0009E60D01|nr:DUF547 domain-containing protein [Kordia zhangzhouensis]
MKYSFLFFCLMFIISCGTQQKTIENSTIKTSEVTKTIIDSVTVQHDKTAKNDALNIKNNQTITTPDSIVYNGTREFTTTFENTHFSHTVWNELLQKYVSSEGLVNYAGLKEDRRKLQIYLYDLGDNQPTDVWTKEEKLAYWINAYNAMTIDLILDSYPARKGIKEIRNPWKQRRWKIGDKVYNLDEIEHDILRNMNEPRIHFAINCASFSCPPLLNEAFTATKLETQLTTVTKKFVADTKRNTITKNQLELSKIFKWFKKDFEKNGSLIDFLNQYSSLQIDTNATISYKEYNWSLNEQ